ncbi:MAG: Ldh family oxidoreductase [Sphaerochaetaceae bacterium]
MVNTEVFLDFASLEKFASAVLQADGVLESDAAIISRILIESDRRGIDSHGIGRLESIYIDRIDNGSVNPITDIVILEDHMATATLDGNNGMGMVVGNYAMHMAIQKATTYGIGMVVVRNSNHYGIAGYYATLATQHDMIGITGTNTRPSTAPTYGVENMLGTNPLAWGFPTDEEFPFILDFATSVVPRGKIEMYHRNGWEIPNGWIIGEDGKSRTDTEGILSDLTLGKAALLPLGGLDTEHAGHKGYSLATAIEMMCSGLQDGPWMKNLNGIDEKNNGTPLHFGHFFIAINPEFFMGIQTCKYIAGTICKELRSSKKAPGKERIYTAGEKEWEIMRSRIETGCPLPISVQNMMIRLRDRWHLDLHWEFEKQCQ